MEMARKIHGEETMPEDMNDEFLIDAYIETFNRAPHPKIKRETMLERLNDAGYGRA